MRWLYRPRNTQQRYYQQEDYRDERKDYQLLPKYAFLLLL